MGIPSKQQSCSRSSVASNLFELLMIHFLVLCVLLLEAPGLSTVQDDLDEVVEQIDENNFAVAVAAKSRRQNQRSFCCLFAKKNCIVPCIGQKCTAQCTVRCGFAGMFTCNPISCQVANPLLCTPATTTTTTAAATTTTTAASGTCDAGWTLTGSKCYKYEAGPSDYYDAMANCLGQGGNLATIESQAEQDAVFALLGSTGGWIGLADFLDEGQFAWLDKTAVSYTNWRVNQPNNSNNNQHCVWIRTDGEWDDVTCKREEAFVCQKAPN